MSKHIGRAYVLLHCNPKDFLEIFTKMELPETKLNIVEHTFKKDYSTENYTTLKLS
jgi:hypothetical protein